MSLLLWDMTTYLGTRIGCKYHMWMICGLRSLQRPMVTDIPYIQVPPKCIMILSRSISGMAWRRTLHSMCPSILIFNRLRENILSLAVWLRLSRFQLGRGNPSIWTLLLVFRRLGGSMTPYRLLWTKWLSLPTLSLWSLLIEPRVTRDSTLMRCEIA